MKFPPYTCLLLILAAHFGAYTQTPITPPCTAVQWGALDSVRRADAISRSIQHPQSVECATGMLLSLAKTYSAQTHGAMIFKSIGATVSSRQSFDIPLFKAALSAFASPATFTFRVQTLKLWERFNGPLNQTAARLMESGHSPAADSLFDICDRLDLLGTVDYYQWQRCKTVLGQYRNAALVACRALSHDPKKNPKAYQLVDIFADAPPESIEVTLDSYTACAQQIAGIDTLSLKLWAAEMFGRFGFVKRKAIILGALGSGRGASADELFSEAQRRLMSGQWEYARMFGTMTYAATAFAATKRQSSRIVATAHARLQHPDSALIWLRRAAPWDVQDRNLAIILNQTLGQLKSADTLLGACPPSLSKDTLTIRQMLLNQNYDQAFSYAAACASSARWSDRPHDAMRWQILSLLFGSRYDRMFAHLDSLQIPPSWIYAHEMLTLTFLRQNLQPFPVALSGWGPLEAHLWAADWPGALRSISILDTATPGRELLVVRAARKCAESGQHAAFLTVRRLLDHAPGTVSAERLYLLGHAYAATGDTTQCQKMLTQCIADFPHDVFSSKARLLRSALLSHEAHPEVTQ